LVKEDQVAISVNGGVNWPLGTPLEYNGPTLMTSFIVTAPNKSEAEIAAAYDKAIAALAKTGPDSSELVRVKAKMRSDLYSELEVPIRRASMLSHAVLFDGTIDRVATAPELIASVTADDVRAFAAKTLVKTNRTIIYRAPETSKPQEPNK
jgi:predicted Zn-dependent peptidase